MDVDPDTGAFSCSDEMIAGVGVSNDHAELRERIARERIESKDDEANMVSTSAPLLLLDLIMLMAGVLATMEEEDDHLVFAAPVAASLNCADEADAFIEIDLPTNVTTCAPVTTAFPTPEFIPIAATAVTAVLS